MRTNQHGLTMVETLVTLIVVLSGLLGLVGLQAKIRQAEVEFYQRAQALALMYDMVDRINANRKAGSCYAISAGSGTPALSKVAERHAACADDLGASEVLADRDLADWDSSLRGVSGSDNGGKRGATFDARGCVTRQTNGDDLVTYAVAVAWRGTPAVNPPVYPDGATVATKRAIDCGRNLYAADAASGRESRRVVWTTFSVANLM